MRDAKRIKPFLQRFEYLWSLAPDLRFGQLMTIIMERMPRGDIFFHEEDIWLKAIEKTIKIAEGKKIEV